jgi:hypothetical protein
MIDIDFKWQKARAYEWAEVAGSKILRPIGDKRYPVLPFKIEGEDPLYIRFSKLDGSEKSCLDFAGHYGPLGEEKRNEAETLKGWQNEIRKIKGAMRMLGAEETVKGGILRSKGTRRIVAPLPSISVTLVPGDIDIDGNVGRPKLLLVPSSLLEALYLQLGKFVSGDGTLRTCNQCHEFFECGATESRHSLALFCSPRCKDRFHYLKRKAS